MLSTNPLYREIYNKNGITLYEPIDDYHASRYVYAGAQNVYSASGATKEFITAVANAVKEMCENQNNKAQLRTDIGTLMNNLLYRTAYPVDEQCAIRMGAVYCLLDDENPEEVNPQIIEQKVKLAHQHPDLYTFFLTVGEQCTPAWNDIDKTSLTSQYYQERRDKLSSLIPISCSQLNQP